MTEKQAQDLINEMKMVSKHLGSIEMNMTNLIQAITSLKNSQRSQ